MTDILQAGSRHRRPAALERHRCVRVAAGAASSWPPSSAAEAEADAARRPVRRARRPCDRTATCDRGRRRRRRRRDRAPSTVPIADADITEACVYTTRRHRLPRRARSSAVQRARCRATPRSVRCWRVWPTGSTSLGRRRAGHGQRRGAPARRTAAPPRRARRPPDGRSRGGPLRRALHDRVVGLVSPARRRHVTAHHRGDAR